MELPLLALALAAGLAVAVYPKYAARRGWRVQPSFRKSGGSIMSIGMASMIGATILIVTTGGPWWYLVAAILAGLLGAFALLHVLKSGIQTLAFAIIAFAWLWYLLVRWGA